MMGMIYGWLAHIMPRQIVFSCLLRAIYHSRMLDRHRGLKMINAIDLMNEWRDVMDGVAREARA